MAKAVFAAAHFTRADLSAMANFSDIKRQFDGVQKTYASMGKMYKATVSVGSRHKRVFKVRLVDTQLLSPANTKSLSALAKLYKEDEEKLDPGRASDGTKYIEAMDRLLQDNPAHYEAYAVRDAEICAKHVEHIRAFISGEFGIEKPPITLGGVSAEVILRYWKDSGVDAAALNGYSEVKNTEFNRAPRSEKAKIYLTRPDRKYHPNFILHATLAKLCFHGGRNESYAYGPTSHMSPGGHEVYEPDGKTPVRWREFDLKGAYLTALSALRIPDYDAARATIDPADFQVDGLGYARVRFQFPPDCRFPCLPVDSANDRGLIYQGSGESYATAPEIALARSLGAELTILHGVVIPWVEGSDSIFQSCLRDLRRRREASATSFENAMFKQIGNGIYGKLGQGLKGKKSYNTRTGKNDEIGESKITNPYLAAHVTGLIRALLSELIVSAGAAWTVISATTDSIVTNCQFGEVNLTGPVASYMIRVAEELNGEEDLSPGRGILEQKAEALRLLPWRTRGIATLDYEGRPKLARGGMREPGSFPRGDGSAAANAWFIKMMLTCDVDDRYVSSEPRSFPEAHKRSLDLVYSERAKKFSFAFDFKRKPVSPIAIRIPIPRVEDDGTFDLHPENGVFVDHLSFNTVPWQMVEEFNAYRELFEVYRTKRKGRMRTLEDWQHWEDYRVQNAAGKAGVRHTLKGGLVDQALRLFRRAYVRGAWGLPGGDYRRAAEAITAAGFPTKEQAFKDASRLGGELPEHLFPSADPAISNLLRAILTIWPEFECWRMVDGPWEPVAPAQNRQSAQVNTASSVENNQSDQEVAEKVETVRMRDHMGATPLSTSSTSSALADPIGQRSGYSVDELFAGWTEVAEDLAEVVYAALQARGSAGATFDRWHSYCGAMSNATFNLIRQELVASGRVIKQGEGSVYICANWVWSRPDLKLCMG
jgi:hypothetical protein